MFISIRNDSVTSDSAMLGHQFTDEMCPYRSGCGISTINAILFYPLLPIICRSKGETCSTDSLEGPHPKGIWGFLGLLLSSSRPTKPIFLLLPRFLTMGPPVSINSKLDIILYSQFFGFIFHDHATVYQLSSLSIMILIRFPVLMPCPNLIRGRRHLSYICIWSNDPTLFCES